MRELIKRYFEETIQTKKSMRRRIYQLESELKEAHKNEAYAIDQKEKYKQRLKKLKNRKEK